MLIIAGLLLAVLSPLSARYPEWRHSGTLTILTTPDGANLPATASVVSFPLLVRLDKDWFDFSQAKVGGEDIRFSTGDGKPLAYEVDTWDASKGTACIWVRVPEIEGDARQELKMFWGKADARSESSGSAVFNESNGYLGVWHMNDPVKDVTGDAASTDTGTTATAGAIGIARHFAVGKGIHCGNDITSFPKGSAPHTSEAWFRPERPNAIVLAWGNEAGQGKVTMRYSSPPHVEIECYFSGANVAGESALAPGRWAQVVHTYRNGDSRIYVDGVLDGVSSTTDAPLAIKSPARMYIGGWYDDYRFVGYIDEVRISNVTRSADWVKLQYENQKTLQTLVGPLVQPGSDFTVSEKKIDLDEGKSVALTAKAGGAQKVYWLVERDGRETVAAVDRFAFTLDAGRVTGDTSLTLRFKAVFPNEVKTLDIPVTIHEAIPDPIFTLKAPSTWDGRKTIEVLPQVTNLHEMQAKGAGDLKTKWSVSPFAVIKEIAPGRLLLKRAQNSGALTVTATIDNGGKPITRAATIAVKEPKSDPWVTRRPDPDEKPEDGQFYARDDRNEGTLYYNGKLDGAAESVFLRVYADATAFKSQSAKPAADGCYAFTVKLKPGLIRYRVEFGTERGGKETVQRTVSDIVCGDAYLIDGQSNALATDTGEKSPPQTNEWIRSYGRVSDNPDDKPGNLWCKPVWKAENGENAEVGWWGMELAKRLLASQKVPIFLLNAAVGGTRIDEHQRNPANPTDLSTIYGRMLWRVRHAKLTHGIRGILWHQGENDQGADGPTGGYGWETYQQLFMDMAAGWKQDFPNVKHYYVFQIWPDACSMGGRKGSGDMLREKQRTLPRLFSNMSIMSTLGIHPPGPCHYPLAGWAEFARLIQPIIERDNYGKMFTVPVTPANLARAYFSNARRDEVSLEFDQPVVWKDSLAGQFYLDGAEGKLLSGATSGNVLTLKLKEPSTAKKITYLKEIAWSQDTLLMGANGLAALTFCDVPIEEDARRSSTKD